MAYEGRMIQVSGTWPDSKLRSRTPAPHRATLQLTVTYCTQEYEYRPSTPTTQSTNILLHYSFLPLTMASHASSDDGGTFDARTTDTNDDSSFPAPASLDYSNVDSEAFYNQTHTSSESLYHQDATEIVHEMHLALLYLLSNPEEFKKVLSQNPPRGGGALTLDEWNAVGDLEEEEDEESVVTAATSNVPLPYVVFADDSEVVLPQAHTASQLFGLEQVEGIELEAAAGIPALSQLFLRWLGELVCCCWRERCA